MVKRYTFTLANGSLDSATPLHLTRITHTPARAPSKQLARCLSITAALAYFFLGLARFGRALVDVVRYDYITILVMAGAVLLALAKFSHL